MKRVVFFSLFFLLHLHVPLFIFRAKLLFIQLTYLRQQDTIDGLTANGLLGLLLN